MERLVGQPIRPVAASDIRMDPGKPDLLQVPRPPWRAGPKAGLERLAAFVDREGVIGVLDRVVKLNVVILVLRAIEDLAEESRRAQRANGVPHSDEANGRTVSCPAYSAERLRPLR